MKNEKISTGYIPRRFQKVLHNSLKRFNVLVCHRRFGKTVFSINEMIDQSLRNTLRNPQYGYIAPTYGQAKRVAWDMLKEFTKSIPGGVANEAELRFDIKRPHLDDRVRFMLLGAENPGSLKGLYLDGVILDEFAECDPRVWGEVVRPALSDRMGWGIFIGTPKGQNHFYDVYQTAQSNPSNWFSAVYKASDTNVIPKVELEQAKQEMSDEEYEQEFECSFSAALVGAYYGKRMSEAEKSGRVTKVPYDPALSVETYWDLGIGDTTAIWFSQTLGKEVRLIDYYETSGQGLDHYAKLLKEKPYVYENHFLPHDAAARELGTGKSRQEVLISHGIRGIIVPRQKVEDGINAVRMILPRCYFNIDKCKRGIEALKSYEKKWDSKNKLFVDKPKHNWASHGADAFRFRMLGLALKSDKEKRRPSTFQQYAESDYDILGGF
jgi:hypothetical protein